MSLTKGLLGRMPITHTNFMLDDTDYHDIERVRLDDDYGDYCGMECRKCCVIFGDIDGNDLCNGCRDATDW